MADDIMAALDNVLSTYKAGGDFATGRAEALKGTERKYTAGAQQGLVSRGLAGTTIASSIPGAFEQDVAAPYRTETERLRSGNEMQGLLAKAGFLQADEERALREKLAGADIASREKIAAGDQSTRLKIGQMGRQGRTSTSQMSTFESRKAERDAASASSAAPAGPTQHVGGAGGLDFGIDYGGSGDAGGGSFGGMSMADLTPAERSQLTPGYYHDAEGYPSAKSGDPNDPIEPIEHYDSMVAGNPALQTAMNNNLTALLQKLMGG